MLVTFLVIVACKEFACKNVLQSVVMSYSDEYANPMLGWLAGVLSCDSKAPMKRAQLIDLIFCLLFYSIVLMAETKNN